MTHKINKDKEKLHANEGIKTRSNYLRGTLQQSLENKLTGSLAEDDTQVIKFHGAYQQFDRELESERKRQKLEQLYSYMIRVRIPGGVVTPEQWLALDKISDDFGNGTIKATTRQAIQFHGISKWALKKSIKAINDTLLDTIAACGDVNRNVMATVHPGNSNIYNDVQEFAKSLSYAFTPQTRAYAEIWLDGKKVKDSANEDDEPIYGKTYLPRKFKIAIAIPPNNDVDVFANDLGFIAIEKNGELLGYNVTVGGGLGSTFGAPETYARIADLVGFVTPEKAVDVAKKIITIQRDYGNREDRKLARFKYTIDRLGFDWFVKELHHRLGYELEPSKEYSFDRSGDILGWSQSTNGNWFLGLYIEGGRLQDDEVLQYRSALRAVAKVNAGDFRFTGNQNLIIGEIAPDKKNEIEKILNAYGIIENINKSGIRRNSVACVALNTCPLAYSEAERYLPTLVGKIEDILAQYGLVDDEITIRMTGCPNGCGRPWLGEIGFIGKAPGLYNMYLGAGFAGERLNSLYAESLNEEQILSELTPIIKSYSESRNEGERFGDFVIRQGIVGKGMEVKPEYRFRNINFQI